MSLAYDALELVRPALADSVMQWLASRTFKKDDFAVFEQGVVRLSATIAREVAGLVIKAIPLSRYLQTVRMVERMH